MSVTFHTCHEKLIYDFPLFIEISYQINDCEAKIIFAAEDTLDKVRECCRALQIPESRIYLLTLEKKGKQGIRTLGDLMEYGEMEWERITDKIVLKKR